MGVLMQAIVREMADRTRDKVAQLSPDGNLASRHEPGTPRTRATLRRARGLRELFHARVT